MSCDHKFIDSTRCLKCGWEAPKTRTPLKLAPETPDQKSERDNFPHELELRAGVAALLHVAPRYARAWVLGIKFEAPDLDGLAVEGIQMEHYEQLAVSPVPAVLFNGFKSLILPVAHARLGLELKLRSSTDQRIAVRVKFSECKHGEPKT